MSAAPPGADGATILVVAGPDAELGALTDAPDVLRVEGEDEARARLRADPDATDLAVLVGASGATLQLARQLRSSVPQLAVAVLVPARERRQTEDRLAFVPQVRDLIVVDADAPPAAVLAELREHAERAREHRRLRRALDAMNRDLDAAAGDRPPSVASVSEGYLAALTRHLPEGVLAVDVDGRVVTCNASAAPLLAVPADEVEGRRVVEVLGTSDVEALTALVARGLAGETRDLSGMTTRDADGEERLLDLTGAPVRSELGRVVGLVIVVRDVTEQRRTEERLRALQQSESLATLAGGVAHDFNNLLVQVQSWADLASEDVTDVAMVEDALEHIGRASRRAAELARSMLAYAGRGSFELEETDPNALVREMASLLHASISRKTEVVFDLATDLPPLVADATQLRQVVLNLVTNAAEAIGDGAGRIDVRTRATSVSDQDPGATGLDPGVYVVIEVEDSGKGMDEATRARIFDPFFSTKFTGRGLGLAASLGIVRAHGGTIDVRSRPGHGARFQVLLPARADGEGEA